jgi:hypothetical protein
MIQPGDIVIIKDTHWFSKAAGYLGEVLEVKEAAIRCEIPGIAHKMTVFHKDYEVVFTC